MLRATRSSSSKVSEVAGLLRKTPYVRNARCIASSSKPTSLSARANLGLATRRPLALVAAQEAWKQRRQYAIAAEETNKGVDPNDSFLQGNTADYIDEMYLAWRKDPSSVHISWQTYFHNIEEGNMPISQAFQPPPTLVPTPTGGVPQHMPTSRTAAGAEVSNHLKVQLLVRAYQARGHHKAKIDPLGIRGEAESFGYSKPKELELEHYGFTEADLDQEFALGPGILPRFETETRKKMTLREIIGACERIYCGSFGIEYIHIPDREPCDWIRDRVEIPQPYKYSVDEKRRILDRLIWSTSFEAFLATKFPNDKRFGLEGCETLVPGMKALIDRSVDYGIKDIVIGMPHRGRLNVLSNVVRKPNESIFSEFTLSLVANPSHLEAEDPVVLGKTRAIQHYNNDEKNFNSAMGVLLHGDAAFAAQGIVYETMGFHSLPAYSTGGTIHIIAIEAPVFHVNADDVEAVNFVCQLAADWRAQFKSDVVIDIVCYRKQGHNETDQPAFTQPLMYKRIADQTTQLDKYVNKLLQENTFTKEDIEEHKKWVWGMLNDSFDRSKEYQPTSREWLTSAWNGFKSPKELATEVLPHLPTGVSRDTLRMIGDKIGETPQGFSVHRNLKRILANRKKTVDEGNNIDWATAEALAFGTLCNEGHHVRVSGQDVERGTFSQRHAVLHDQQNEATYTPLQHISENQGTFVISNSSLSEFGVLGFEYGYSLTSPNALVMWEAQFGDFANNAQCIIDQFIASGEVKWLQRSGLVMSLPHGYDGQGPEHSSGRLERYLQLSNEDPLYRRPEKIERVILCSGQVWAALVKHRDANGIKNTAITRIEQLNPFPWQQLKENLDSYPNAKDIVWCQEEPLNAGAWSFVQPRIETLLNNTEHHNRRHVLYAGRNPSASVATGLKASHIKEEQELLQDAFTVHQDKLKGQ
ncbi:2-oxoglutarate dehydrogenase E1 component [Coccidioides immitis RMSCC 3703]|uniref:2-oxoglutarate dehydrogenase, mitochondrial n=1 Tax=Coccidioides immitis RMSCC 3703 TaxID=454286 RepID=A0A0J8QWM3_COCIT|nr:2-oxoglutarate dehydrogenase E1 component [Coccidioides immitis RMSCC 3703]